MTLFEWLLVGHLVGDWIFQNDWMVRHKQNGFLNRAILVHCTVYTLTILAVLLIAVPGPAGLFPLLLAGALVYVSHWLIDASGAAGRWMRFFGQTDVLFMRIAVDQILHILVLALVTEFLL